MASNLNDGALMAAGVVGIITAGLHGVIMQSHMIAPLDDVVRSATHIPRVTRRLIAPLLHVSTVAWFLCGLLLIWAGARATAEPRLVAASFGLASYGYAAVANFIAVRGVHPGWILMSTAVLLIVAGVAL